MGHIETEEEWQANMSVKVMNFIKKEVYQNLPYMGVALEAVRLEAVNGSNPVAPVSEQTGKYFATNGEVLYFHAESVNRLFKSNSLFLDRAYLHCLFHCLFYHPWMLPKETMSKADWNRYHLATDIATEYVIDQIGKPCTKRILSLIRRDLYARIEKECVLPSALFVFDLIKEEPDEALFPLAEEFTVDDHSLWPKPQQGQSMQNPSSSSEEMKKKWEKLNHQTQLMQKKGRQAGEEAAEKLSDYLSQQKNQRSYADFLKRFTRLREERKVDPDSFDYGYYCYGLSVYKNMPLIEELESRENRKVDSFVIVIDTSDSTKGEPVRAFLKETAEVLANTGSFFDRAQIHILMVDDEIRYHQVVRSFEEFTHLSDSPDFKIRGGGGTDFRPAFSYVEELRKSGELRELCGLLYFTDGMGIYPAKKPEYNVAFLLQNDYNGKEVPNWAMRLQVRF